MKYPLEVLEAVAQITEDPDDAAEVLQAIEECQYRLMRVPSRANGGTERIARLVQRIVVLEFRIQDRMEKGENQKQPHRADMRNASDRAEVSSLRWMLDLMDVKLDPSSVYYYLTQARPKYSASLIDRYEEERVAR